MPTWQGRYLARDAPDATKKPKTKRKSGMEGRYLKETQDVMVAKDVNTRVEDQSSKTQCLYNRTLVHAWGFQRGHEEHKGEKRFLFNDKGHKLCQYSGGVSFIGPRSNWVDIALSDQDWQLSFPEAFMENLSRVLGKNDKGGLQPCGRERLEPFGGLEGNVFEQQHWNIHHVFCMIASSVVECKIFLCKNAVLVGILGWSYSIPPFMKLNIDGRKRDNLGRMGIGGVLRDCVGHWVLDFAKSLGKAETPHAKLLVVKVGLEACWNKSLVCEIDYLEVFSLFDSRSQKSHWDVFHDGD
ncbi:hypothetical protein JHK85_032341 [Glycine max]|nr:hypothetical protein JHK85_032341 [Glycine max]